MCRFQANYPSGQVSLMFLVGTLCLGVGCAPGDTDDGNVAPAQIREWEEELMEADRAFAQATARLGAEGWVSFFAPEGSMISEGVGETRGTEAIRARIGPAFANPSATLRWEPQRAEVSGSGDLGYTVGRWESTGTDATGQAVRNQGLYVSIWRRQPDGSWKVVMDLGNPTTAPEG